MGSRLRALPRGAVYLERFQYAAARMARATQFAEVLSAAVEQAEEFLGAVGGMLVLLDASRRMLVVTALENVPASVLCGNKSLPLTAHIPMADAVNEGRAVWISGAAERARRYPELAARTPENYACGSLPLADGEASLGLLCLIRMAGGAAPRPFDETERGFASVLADVVTAAVGRLAGVRERAAGEDTGAQDFGLYEWDPVSDRLYRDAGMLRLHGLSPAAGARPGAEAFPGELAGFAVVAHELAVRGDGQVVSYPCPVRDGQPRTLEARGHLINNRRNGGPRLVGVVRLAMPADGDRAASLSHQPASAALLGELSAALAAAVTMDDFR
jgi:hypothetical protein